MFVVLTKLLAMVPVIVDTMFLLLNITNIRPNKIICVFLVSPPTLIFPPDPELFIAFLRKNILVARPTLIQIA